ncbi:MAG: hypothetical protein HFK00_08515 [Oscillospiraceae bacterium]|nr:hypothetical protein [Oscillospiraceae bacterium]
MNKRQKEVIKYTLEQEKKIISELKDVYKKALEDIGEKIKILMSDEMTQSKIYQIEFQNALQGQISAILENKNSNQYERVYDYLKGCYEDGFIGTIYDLQGQGLPLILPLNQEEIVEALLIESKISEGLYTKMGNNVEVLKKNISFEIARGISTSSPYSQIARNLRSSANMTLNQSMRIVRTEGNRIHNKSALDACRRAKEAGADVLKMWDATLDGLTRPRHRQLDGQIREVTEDFEVDGLTVSAPLHFGIAAEDCNCRCHLLTKARWEMNESFTKWNNETSELMYFDNVKDYQDFKKNYWNHVDNSGKSGIISIKDSVSEKQRYGRNKDTLVNKAYIDSGEYRRKFDNATENPAVNKTLYDCAKKALKHRGGTIFEDMYWIDRETGNVILSVTDSTDERAIVYTDRIRRTIKNKKNFITIHTHRVVCRRVLRI